METVLVEKKNINEVVELLKQDEVVAFPTETVFGLGVKFGNLSALEKIYEIKHSDKIVLQQCRHLLDKQKCEDTAFRYGTIIGKYVIYRGATTSLVQAGVSTQEDVAYLNVEEYLKKL
mgnify:FL=1